jgi:replication factor C subunit 2/4
MFSSSQIKFSGRQKAPRPSQLIPWVEKYRPRTIDEISHQDEVVRTLRKCLETGNLPHLLFYGPPGTGKTSTILALARQLFGAELMRERVLELNASDERGIDVIRNKVKRFAQVSVTSQPIAGAQSDAQQSTAVRVPGYKLIVLDEVDNMSSDAQNALRRIIEMYSHVTRFCLICNYISKVIDPLTSRCAKFRFQPLPLESVKLRLTHICTEEKIFDTNVAMSPPAREQVTSHSHARVCSFASSSLRQCSFQFLQSLVELCEGDLRKAITYLQSVHRLYSGELTTEALHAIAGTVPLDVIATLLRVCREGNFERIQTLVTDVVAEGYAASTVLRQLFDYVVAKEDPTRLPRTSATTNTSSESPLLLSDRQKSLIVQCIAQSDKALLDGADEFLQLLSVAAQISRILATASPPSDSL